MIDQLTNLVTGLEASLKDLNSKKDLFTKAQGLNEQAEKLRAEAGKIKSDLSAEKAASKKLTDSKNKAMQTTTESMAEKMNAVLPSGSAAIEIKDDGSLMIGWNNGKTVVPYSGLSGGEKAAFDPALCKALGGTIMIIEAAEVDDDHITEALRRYDGAGIQCIVSSCHPPKNIPLGWNVVQL